MILHPLYKSQRLEWPTAVKCVETFFITKSPFKTVEWEQTLLELNWGVSDLCYFSIYSSKLPSLKNWNSYPLQVNRVWGPQTKTTTNLWRSGCSPALFSAPPQTAPWNVSARVCPAGTEGPSALWGHISSAGFRFTAVTKTHFVRHCNNQCITITRGQLE